MFGTHWFLLIGVGLGGVLTGCQTTLPPSSLSDLGDMSVSEEDILQDPSQLERQSGALLDDGIPASEFLEFVSLKRCEQYPISLGVQRCLKMPVNGIRQKTSAHLESVFEVSVRRSRGDVRARLMEYWMGFLPIGSDETCPTSLQIFTGQVIKACTVVTDL